MPTPENILQAADYVLAGHPEGVTDAEWEVTKDVRITEIEAALADNLCADEDLPRLHETVATKKPPLTEEEIQRK